MHGVCGASLSRGVMELKGILPYIKAKFRKVTKVRNLACDHDVGM